MLMAPLLSPASLVASWEIPASWCCAGRTGSDKGRGRHSKTGSRLEEQRDLLSLVLAAGPGVSHMPAGSESMFQGPSPCLLGVGLRVSLRSLPPHDLSQQQEWGRAVGVWRPRVPEPSDSRICRWLVPDETDPHVCLLSPISLSRLSEP